MGGFLVSKTNSKNTTSVNKNIDELLNHVGNDLPNEFYYCVEILENLTKDYEILNNVIECINEIMSKKSIKFEEPKNHYGKEPMDEQCVIITKNGITSIRIKIYDLKKKTELNISEHGIRVTFNSEGFLYTCSYNGKSIIDLEGSGTLLSLKYDIQQIKNLIPTLYRWHHIN